MDNEHYHMDQLERIVYFCMYNHKYILDSNTNYHRLDNHLVVVGVVDEWYYNLDQILDQQLDQLDELRLIRCLRELLL
jgi:hypothetical protein